MLEWPPSKRSNVGKYVGERELSGTVDGNINWCSHSGEQYGDFSKKKLKIELPYDPAISLLCIYPKRGKNSKQKLI